MSYCSSSLGDDGNAGTIGSPWVHCPGMPDWTGDGEIAAGDTVYFRSEDTWTCNTGSWALIPMGGVTYDGSTWGTGTRAKIQAAKNYTWKVIMFMVDSDRFPYRSDHASLTTTVKGFAIDGGGLSGFNNTGVTFMWSCSTPDGNLDGATKRVEDCVITNCGNAGAGAWEYGVEVGVFGGYNTENVEIINCNVSGTGSEGIDAYVSQDETGYINNVTIRGCTVTDTGNVDIANAMGIGIFDDVRNSTVEFNYIYDTDNGGICIGPKWKAGPTNLTVRYNILNSVGSSNLGAGIIIHGMAYVTSADFYGNIIIQPSGYGIIIEGAAGGTHSYKFYNNTIYLPTRQGIVTQTLTSTYTVFAVVNNIVYITGYFALQDTSTKLTAHNNNLYYRTDGGDFVSQGGTGYTAAEIIDPDTGWEKTAQVTDPTFKNTADLPTGFTGTYGTDMIPNADGLSLQAGSPAKDTGADIGGTPYYGAINISGTNSSSTRDTYTPWDMGAYEYGEGGTESAGGTTGANSPSSEGYPFLPITGRQNPRKIHPKF